MTESYTLIISIEEKSDNRFYLVPNSEISTEKRKVLNHVCNMKLNADLPDEEYDKIVSVKYAIAHENTSWFPSTVPKEWRGCFSKYKSDVPVFCPNITSVIVLN